MLIEESGCSLGICESGVREKGGYACMRGSCFKLKCEVTF